MMTLHKPITRGLAAASLAALALSFAATGAQASFGAGSDRQFGHVLTEAGSSKGGQSEIAFVADDAFLRDQSEVLGWSAAMRTAVDTALAIVFRGNPGIFAV